MGDKAGALPEYVHGRQLFQVRWSRAVSTARGPSCPAFPTLHLFHSPPGPLFIPPADPHEPCTPVQAPESDWPEKAGGDPRVLPRAGPGNEIEMAQVGAALSASWAAHVPVVADQPGCLPSALRDSSLFSTHLAFCTVCLQVGLESAEAWRSKKARTEGSAQVRERQAGECCIIGRWQTASELARPAVPAHAAHA